MRSYLYSFILLAYTSTTYAQSTSPHSEYWYQNPTTVTAPNESKDGALGEHKPKENTPEDVDPENPLTFSEFPIDTTITNQYADRGLVMTLPAFISPDGANPTSPVLSGVPRFVGPIGGRFVDPEDASRTLPVKSFTIDAGFFDNDFSTRIEWFDKNNNRLGQKSNSTFGIENFVIEGGDIASWRFSTFADEPAGFAVDNIAITPIGSSMLFREKSGDEKDGTWGLFVDQIPGFDHVAFHRQDLVFESHPGYPAGTYVSEDGEEQQPVPQINAVQQVHTRATFEHDSRTSSSPVIDFEEIPIDEDDATAMQAIIEAQIAAGKTFQFINFSDIDGIEQTLSPAAQKGGDNTFTCVGLVEFAAEAAGVGGGSGYIPNIFESVEVPVSLFPFETRTLPFLSPQLLNYWMKGRNSLSDVQEWVQGLFDPVDFLIVDPLGRRVGYTDAEGELNEIPYAFFSGNGNLEQFFIPNPVPGLYTIQLYGLDSRTVGGAASRFDATGIDQVLASGDTGTLTLRVEVVPGGTADIDGDGDLTDADLAAMDSLLGTFVNGGYSPADLNGDGIIDMTDRDLLADLLLVYEGEDELVLLADELIQIESPLASAGRFHSNGDITFARGLPSIHDGSLTAVKDIKIQELNRIERSVRAGGRLKVSGDATVVGNAQSLSPVQPIALALAPFEAGGIDVTVGKFQSLTLPAGIYGNLIIEEGSTLTLLGSADTAYYFDTVSIKPDSVVSIMDVVAVNVVGDIQIGDRAVVMLAEQSLTAENSQWATLQRFDIAQNTSFQGQINAPFGQVEINQGSVFEGTVAARKIVIGNSVQISIEE